MRFQVDTIQTGVRNEMCNNTFEGKNRKVSVGARVTEVLEACGRRSRDTEHMCDVTLKLRHRMATGLRVEISI